MKLTFPFFAVLAMLVMVGCQSLYDSAVTIVQVEDRAMHEWASLSKSGQTSPKIDAAVMTAHAKFKTACDVAANALEAYKASGDNNKYLAALTAVRQAAGEVIDLIVPMLNASQSAELQTNLAKAQKL